MATKSVTRSGNNKFDVQFTFDDEDLRRVFSEGANPELYLRLQGPDSDAATVAEFADAVGDFAELSAKALEAEAKAKP